MASRRTARVLGSMLVAAAAVGAVSVAVRKPRPARPRPSNPSPLSPEWTAPPARFGVGLRRNVAVPMSDGVVLRANVHYPTVPETGAPADGPFPVLLSITPYGKLAPPPAAQIGGGPSPHLIRRGYIEVMVDVRGTGASGGLFEMFGPDQTRDGVELVTWASKLPNANGRVGMFGISYLAINQLFTAAAVGPDSPLKAIFPVMAANDFYRDAAAMGGALHLRTVRGYGSLYTLLNVLNPALEFLTPGSHSRPRAGGLAAVRQRGRAQRDYFGPLTAEARTGGDAAYDGPFWDSMRPDLVLPQIAANNVAVFLTGGWHDAFQRGEPLNYAGLQNACSGRSPSAPMQPGQPLVDRIRLMMGPWYHVSDYGGLNLLDLQLRWFDHWLKGADTGIMTGPPIRYVLPGAEGWHTAEQWPPADAVLRDWALRADGVLAADEGDPGARTLMTLGAGTGRVGPSPVDPPALLDWTSAPMEHDLDVVGDIELRLTASATATDTAWLATLQDIAPDGTAADVTAGYLRAGLRTVDDAASTPGAPVLPCRTAVAVPVGQPIEYRIPLVPNARRFAAGHRIRVVLTSDDQNPETPAIMNFRHASVGTSSVNTVASASRLVLPVVG